jgi:conjugative relaxase-like TrwC/TraI family protein
MQTTHKIPGSSATRWSKYLLSQRSRADYQLRDGDRPVPTRWHGSPTLLASLGLDAREPVELRDLRPLMHGYNPRDGEPIRPAGADGTRTAGIDLTFSPPKNVSALWAVSSPYRRAQIEAAHRKAVASTLRKIERDINLVRRKTRGVVRFEKAQSLLAAESVHTTSRLSRDQDSSGIPDPQLHSHVAVIAAERLDGKIAAVESRQLYLAARETGAWYRSELAHNLQQLGLVIERRAGKDERYFNITGVPQELSERWSVRTGDVDRAAQAFRRRYGREPEPGELDSFTLKTRGPKSTAAEQDINRAWRAIAQEYDLTSDRADGLFNDRPHALKEEVVGLAKELLVEVNRDRSMITTSELNAKAYELSASVCRPAEADQLVHELERAGELVRLEQGMWTTRELREIEHETMRIARERTNHMPAEVSGRAIERAREAVEREIGAPLTAEQQQALRAITGPGGVSILIGQAGTGKGVAINAATRAWELEGHEVIGTAIAGATAKRLQADAKLDRSMTTDSLLNRIEKGHIKLNDRTVVIMDEAGMADTRRLSRLVALTAERQSKLLLVGDSRQLSPVGPGGVFRELEQQVPTAQLSQVHRARHGWERTAWREIRDGEPGKALARYQAHDRLHLHDTRKQAAERMVRDWHHNRRQAGGRSVMITDASNQERDQINALAQQHRARAGELGGERVPLPGKPYGLAAGDEIIFTSQHRILGHERVENGTLGRVLDTRESENRVLVQTSEREPRQIEIDTREFSDLSLAYALHIYKAQGLTTDTAHVLTGGWQTDREHAYVALTRARNQTHVYLSREDLGEHGMDVGAIERLADLMARSRTQEATITRDVAEPTSGRTMHSAEPASQRSTDTELKPQNYPQRTLDDERERNEQALDRENKRTAIEQPTPMSDRDQEIKEILEAMRRRQLDWERGIGRDRGNDRGYGIE